MKSLDDQLSLIVLAEPTSQWPPRHRFAPNRPSALQAVQHSDSVSKRTPSLFCAFWLPPFIWRLTPFDRSPTAVRCGAGSWNHTCLHYCDRSRRGV